MKSFATTKAWISWTHNPYSISVNIVWYRKCLQSIQRCVQKTGFRGERLNSVDLRWVFLQFHSVSVVFAFLSLLSAMIKPSWHCLLALTHILKHHYKLPNPTFHFETAMIAVITQLSITCLDDLRQSQLELFHHFISEQGFTQQCQESAQFSLHF